jgi:hypothetical protein
MFGGQDNTAATQQNDDTLKGVTDLVGGTATAIPVSTAGTSSEQNDTSMSNSSNSVSSAPALPGDTPQSNSSMGQPTGGNDELLGIKQQALQQLTPLINHLDQTPLERFRTLMMLIQASDNQTLLKEAYGAAQKIEDDKVRAQALLDVINEINYFTQPKG